MLRLWLVCLVRINREANHTVCAGEEPQNDCPESLPQQIRRIGQESPLLQWLGRYWAPVSVLLAFTALAVLLRLNEETLQRGGDQHLHLGILGALFSGQVFCACWAAWAPNTLIWRVPLAIAAAAVLCCSGPQDPDSTPAAVLLVLYAAILLFYGLIFSLARWIGGWRLVDRHEQHAAGLEKFNLRYLFVLTAIVASVMTLGRLFIHNTPNTANGGPPADELLGMVVVMAGVFCLVQAPAGFAFLFPLVQQPRWGIMLLFTPILVSGCSYASVMVIIAVQPVAQFINEMWGQLAAMSGGATTTLLVSATLLRIGGYRLTNRKAADA